MSTWQVYVGGALCSCVFTVAASVASASEGVGARVIELSEQMMERIVGGGNIDVEMNEYKLGGTPASAKVANRTLLYVNYELNLTDTNGGTVQTLASGTLAPGEAALVSGAPPYGGTSNKYIQIRAFSGLGAMEAIDTSWAPSSIDSDDDGLTDKIETAHGLNPFDPTDADADFDADGLTNKDEILVYGTNIRVADTDGDGLDDGLEVAMGFDPQDDEDGLSDPDMDYVSTADEIVVYGTDPYIYNGGLVQDTDGDGVNDTLETRLGMDPANADIKSVGGDTPDDKQLMHALNRLTFGATTDSVSDIAAMGAVGWFADQAGNPLVFDTLDKTDPAHNLDPAQITRLAYAYQGDNVERHGAIRPLHSIKEIQARMALFWDNHFSTYKNVVNYPEAELHEEDLFFVNALGNFRTLLGESAKSDAMMRYLDLKNSSIPEPNENYAREVMELHTLGVTTAAGIYTPDDVQALARILSGWSTSNQGSVSLYDRRQNDGSLISRALFEYTFRSSNHDTGPKTFLGVVFDGTGDPQMEGETALDMLAQHPQTAQFICTKLAKAFVSDNPLPETVASCKSEFMAKSASPTQIADVLKVLFNSAEFNSVQNQRAKFKDNQEYLISLGRVLRANAIGGSTSLNYLNGTAFGEELEDIGQGLFNKSPPTGYKEDPSEWITTNAAISRFREGVQLSLSYSNTDSLAADFRAKGITTAGGVMRELFKMMLGGEYTLDHMVMGYWELYPGGSPFDINDEAQANARIRNLIARLAQLPEFNLH